VAAFIPAISAVHYKMQESKSIEIGSCVFFKNITEMRVGVFD